MVWHIIQLLSGYNGTISLNGSFNYVSGDTIYFYVGDVLIGSTTGKSNVTPVDLVDTQSYFNPTVLNIVRFLMTLDSDNNPANGIEINSSVNIAFISQTIDFNQTISAFYTAYNSLISNATGKTLYNETYAIQHYNSTLIAIGINTTTPAETIPTLSFSTNTSFMYNGSTATLSWTSSDVTSCSASGDWSGSKSTSGSENVTPTSNSTYTLTCDSLTYSINISPLTYACEFDEIYSYTGSLQQITVPTGCSVFGAKLWGAGVGGGTGTTGGAGGFTKGNFTVYSGQVLQVLVGGYGVGGSSGVQTSGGGGGLSGIFNSTYTHGNSILIAGGGGGANGDEFATYHRKGGAGGGLIGEYGDHFSGAHLTPGGGQTDNYGSLPSGGAYGDALLGLDGYDYSGGIGGGKAGGYGGGDGADGTDASYPSINSGGGGGSGYIGSNIVLAGASTTAGSYNVPAGTTDPDYVSGRAYGGGIYTNGQNGLVVIRNMLISGVNYSELNFSSNISSFTTNASINLSWDSNYFDTCVATGNWSGTKETSGSIRITNASSDLSFTLNCYSGIGNTTKTININQVSCTQEETVFSFTDSIQYFDTTTAGCTTYFIQI